MFVEKLKSEGLAHLSYLLGAGGEAVVIDPRRDCDAYVSRAAARGCRITHIFETHRHEDLVSGAAALAQQTGAPVHHGPNAEGEVQYADTVREGDSFTLGDLRIEILETPGHTDDSISLVIYDDASGDEAAGVFTGDALFVGDVGRTDFYPERAEEVAGLLFDSLRKIVSIGDQAILYPAHGAGSVCGDGMADREFSTIGHERSSNPMLRLADRDEFIARKLAEKHEQPPYFRRMERLNLEGAPPPPRVIAPRAFDIDRFHEAAGEATVVDVRGTSAFLGAHVPGSICIPAGMVPAMAGWLLDTERELVLVAHDADQACTAARHLARMGFDRVGGALYSGLPGWAAAGHPFRSVATVDADTVAQRLDGPRDDWTLLDVRARSEVDGGMIEGARHVFVGELPCRLSSLDAGHRYTVMCASGARATVAASLLLRAGVMEVDVFLGSMGAWKASGHSVADGDAVQERIPDREALAESS